MKKNKKEVELIKPEQFSFFQVVVDKSNVANRIFDSVGDATIWIEEETNRYNKAGIPVPHYYITESKKH